MRIKVEDAKNLRALSALPRSNDTVKDAATTDSPVLDGFKRDDALEQSPFALRRQLVQLDPYLEIGVTAQSLPAQEPWWDNELLESLPENNLPKGALRADIELALKSLARDKSFLTVNWRDDFN